MTGWDGILKQPATANKINSVYLKLDFIRLCSRINLSVVKVGKVYMYGGRIDYGPGRSLRKKTA